MTSYWTGYEAKINYNNVLTFFVVILIFLKNNHWQINELGISLNNFDNVLKLCVDFSIVKINHRQINELDFRHKKLW